MVTRMLASLLALITASCARSATEEQLLGALGGVRERDGARVDVPAGALTSERPIAVARVNAYPAPPTGTKFSHGVFELTPHGQQFEQPVTVRVPAAAGQVLLTAEPGGTWQPAEGASFKDGLLTIAVRHFSFFAAAGLASRVFFSDGAALRSMDADGGGLATLVPGVLMERYLTGVAVDPAARYVYWTDNMTDRVSRVGYDGTGATVLYTSADKFSNPTGIAVDPAHGKLFWAEGATVRSAGLDGGQLTTVVSGTFPTAVALDPAAERIYWTDNGSDTVSRADYTGANPTVLYTASDAFLNPRGLAIDVASGKLFWAEGSDIRSCALDGSQVATVVTGVAGSNFPDAVALDTTRRLLYWTDNGTDGVHVAPYSGALPRLLFQNPDKFSNPQGVAVDPGN